MKHVKLYENWKQEDPIFEAKGDIKAHILSQSYSSNSLEWLFEVTTGEMYFRAKKRDAKAEGYYNHLKDFYEANLGAKWNESFIKRLEEYTTGGDGGKRVNIPKKWLKTIRDGLKKFYPDNTWMFYTADVLKLKKDSNGEVNMVTFKDLDYKSDKKFESLKKRFWNQYENKYVNKEIKKTFEEIAGYNASFWKLAMSEGVDWGTVKEETIDSGFANKTPGYVGKFSGDVKSELKGSVKVGFNTFYRLYTKYYDTAGFW